MIRILKEENDYDGAWCAYHMSDELSWDEQRKLAKDIAQNLGHRFDWEEDALDFAIDQVRGGQVQIYDGCTTMYSVAKQILQDMVDEGLEDKYFPEGYLEDPEHFNYAAYGDDIKVNGESDFIYSKTLGCYVEVTYRM